MKLKVVMIAQTSDSTLSKMTCDGEFMCFVLEDGHRQVKEYGQTRIPDGTYQVTERKHGGFYEKYRKRLGHEFVPWIQNVPGFEDILIHTGNEVTDTAGCLIVGTAASFNYAAEKPVFNIYPGSSTAAYLRLYDILSGAFHRGEVVEIEVVR